MGMCACVCSGCVDWHGRANDVLVYPAILRVWTSDLKSISVVPSSDRWDGKSNF